MKDFLLHFLQYLFIFVKNFVSDVIIDNNNIANNYTFPFYFLDDKTKLNAIIY